MAGRVPLAGATRARGCRGTTKITSSGREGARSTARCLLRMSRSLSFAQGCGVGDTAECWFPPADGTEAYILHIRHWCLLMSNQSEPECQFANSLMVRES